MARGPKKHPHISNDTAVKRYCKVAGCGVELVIKRTGRPPMFCKPCAKQAMYMGLKALTIQRNAEVAERRELLVTCVCGKEFKPEYKKFAPTTGAAAPKYCSEECAEKAQKQQLSELVARRKAAAAKKKADKAAAKKSSEK